MLDEYQKTFLSELIAIPSVGGVASENRPYGNKPYEALEYFLGKARDLGLNTGILGNRVGYVDFGKGTKLLGIVCHLDVVPAGEGWNSDPFTLTVKDGAMYCRGIVDDKGPAAASFFAIKSLLEEEFDPGEYTIRLILGTDEERTCSCVEYYSEHGQIPDFAITPDADFPAIFCEKGILHIKLYGEGVENITATGGNAANMVPASAKIDINGKLIEAQGKSAHGSKPELGINAITKLTDKIYEENLPESELPVFKFIKEFDAGMATGCTVADESGKLTSNIGILSVNDKEQSVTIDFRVPVTYPLSQAVSILEEYAASYGLKADVKSSMDGIFKDKNSKEIQILTSVWAGHMDKFTGFKEEYRETCTEPLAIGGGTYARHLPNTVAFGVQAPWHIDQCHQADEHVAISDFEEWIAIIKEAIVKLIES